MTRLTSYLSANQRFFRPAEPLPDNVFKMAPDFRGRLGLVKAFVNTEQDGGTFTATTAGSFLSFRATVSIDERKQ